MKTIVFLMAILLSSISIAQTERTNTAQATFGRFSDCSTGRGACSFSASGSTSKVGGGSAISNASKRSIVFKINRNNITKNDEMRIAGKLLTKDQAANDLVFLQEETITIDRETLLDLNLNPLHNKIIAGTYKMSVTKTDVEITFTLSRLQ